MSKTSFTSQPQANLLYQDEEVTITASRIEIKSVSCASKFVSSVTLHEYKPSRIHGWSTLAACAIASLVLLIYLYIGKISVGVYIIAYLATALVGALAIMQLFMLSASYKIEINQINGQMFQIARSSKVQIQEIHAAIKQAVAASQPDYLHSDRQGPNHQADPAKPTGLQLV